MATLDDLLRVEGVVAAFSFGADGKLVDYKARVDMSPEMAAMAAQFCATVTMLFDTLAGAYTQLSKMRWLPQNGWAFCGGEWAVVVDKDRRGAFVELAKADASRVLATLIGRR